LPTNLSLELDPETKAKLDHEARVDQRPVEDVATRAIEAFLDARAFKREQLNAALIEADHGEFISSAAVDRWMASWDKSDELPPPEPDIFLAKH